MIQSMYRMNIRYTFVSRSPLGSSVYSVPMLDIQSDAQQLEDAPLSRPCAMAYRRHSYP